MDKQKWMSV